MKTETEFTIECGPEFEPIESHLSECLNKNEIKGLYNRVEHGDQWAWCNVKVVCTIKCDGEEFRGVTNLGCCSYKDKDEFIVDGYYDNMCSDAMRDAEEACKCAMVRGHAAKKILMGE